MEPVRNHAGEMDAEERKQILLKVFSQTGDMRLARREARTEAEEFERWLDTDSDFRLAYTRARREAVNRLEEAAFHRAIHGTEEPIISGGKVVGHRVRYSDTLLMFLLKSLKPEVYGDKASHSHTSVNVSLQAVNLAQSMSPDELQRMRATLMLEQRKRKSLKTAGQAGPEINDAEVISDGEPEANP